MHDRETKSTIVNIPYTDGRGNLLDQTTVPSSEKVGLDLPKRSGVEAQQAEDSGLQPILRGVEANEEVRGIKIPIMGREGPIRRDKHHEKEHLEDGTFRTGQRLTMSRYCIPE
ncbi:hypothetical protein E2986_13408 [Frieseomelitta varia]|uniref:Uncharacterized protein n=1 Tax=Frieseomelitta varia TaxID=561572 RepID=A0A833VUM9_9HYME|nr:hypothetical protein E2986_13408 [Frieseomelitta varia]